MPTIKPRVNVTLEQGVYDVLKALSVALDQSMGSIVADMISSNVDAFKGVAAMVTVAKAMDSDARSVLSSKLQSAESALSSGIKSGIEMLSMVEGEGGQASPLTINKGVRSNPKVEKSISYKKQQMFLAIDNSGAVKDEK